jgi:hypothetical protein
MLASTPTAAGTGFGAANPDNHSGIQWWQIDPTIETGLSTPPLQRARIEDPTANNCHNGSGGILATAPCNGSTANQVGQFYAFPNISVNQNNDVLIGFTQFTAFTYASSGYAVRLAGDPVNTTRDPVIFRPGQANYNIGAGSGSSRQNRWGDYSAAQTDPLDDTSFWTVQEYAGTVRDFGIGLAGNWETWWSQINPSNPAPSKTGNLIINEFRLRGPQGARDEFVELYNPSTTPVIVNTTDNSDGWALGFSPNGTTVTPFAVIPNGTVIPGLGHFLVADNPDGPSNGPTVVYSLNSAPGSAVRSADSDTGWSLDLADNGGIAIFKTSNAANFNAATRMDSVGFATIAAGLFKEGNGIPAITTGTPAGQYAFYRDMTLGVPKDTDTNENDFRFVDPAIEAFGTTPQLGAAGPQNLDGPRSSTSLQSTLIDPLLPATQSPNRVRNTSSYTDTLSGTGTYGLGTLAVRRYFTNISGAPVTRLRFRLIDVTSGPAPAGTADLRAITAQASQTVTISTGTVTVNGTVLETPALQPNGGGLNSTMIVPLPTPLADRQSVAVEWLLGVKQGGSFRFYVDIEALP